MQVLGGMLGVVGWAPSCWEWLGHPRVMEQLGREEGALGRAGWGVEGL